MMRFLQINDLPLNKIFLILLSIITTLHAYASPYPPTYDAFLDDCDACGCSNNGGSLGMGGVLDTNFVGIRYLFQNYQSKDGIFIDSPKIDEYFNTLQFWSRIPIVEKLEVQSFVPYHTHSRQYVNKTQSISGIGDVTLLINYTLIHDKKGNYNEKTDKISMSRHLLKTGLGIKLPTGNYDEDIQDVMNPSFQLGTGSVDYLANLQYVYKYNNAGCSNYLNYYIKGTNSHDYQFGNQLNFNSTFFYVFNQKRNRFLVPSAGLSGEFYDSNKQFGLQVKDTEGYAVFSSIGIEYNTPKLTVGAFSMYPISQKLAQGTITVNLRSTLYLNYNF